MSARIRTRSSRAWKFASAVAIGCGMAACTTLRLSTSRALSSYDAQVAPLLARMTLDEKIGQMTQGDLSGIKDPADVAKYHLGSVLSGGGSDPKAGNSLAAWTDTYDQMQKEAMKTRLGIPILYGVDAVHGHNNVLGAVIFPHNIGLGATRDQALVERIEKITAEEVRATGIQWVFAPCIAVPQDERWGRTYEGYSEDPSIVAPLGAAAVRGFQGSDWSNPLAVLACAKHYLADGGTLYGSARNGRGINEGDARIDEATLRRIHLPGYIRAVQAGVGSIMPSFSSWNGVKMSANKYLLTDVLKGELGFQGFLISDWSAIGQVDRDYKTAVEKSINAGMDMAMEPERYADFEKNLKDLVNEGKVPMARIDDAVTRILRVKAAMGLLDKGRSQLADRSLWKTFGSPEHRAVARQAVRESLVLLKNDKQTLPLAKTAKRILVAGKSADDMGLQCGGWTIEWQGKRGPITTGGTTILAGIKSAVSPETKVDYALDGAGAEGADAGIVVIGETPYAEGNGDQADLSLAPEDVAAVAAIKKAGIPLVVVLVSGRPMILGDVLSDADAFVAAWLPGSEGEGVADVLFGDFKPTGKLSYSWPRTMAQIPINIGDVDYNPLFPIDFGLSY